MGKQVSTPWGPAAVVEEVEVSQEAEDRDFASHVQLLEGRDGTLLVRFAYATGGVARRGPVTLRSVDVERLREGLGGRRALARALGMSVRRGRG